MILYFDMDGVLADFDAMACAAHGLPYKDPYYYKLEAERGADAFWDPIYEATNGKVFSNLPPIWPGIQSLKLLHHMVRVDLLPHVQAVRVLTKLPRRDSQRNVCADQKVEWLRAYLPQLDDTDIICVPGDKAKATYCTPGDILIDDHGKNWSEWWDAGGCGILHQDDWDKTNFLIADALSVASCLKPGERFTP